jgi:hypothetical protein
MLALSVYNKYFMQLQLSTWSMDHFIFYQTFSISGMSLSVTNISFYVCITYIQVTTLMFDYTLIRMNISDWLVNFMHL